MVGWIEILWTGTDEERAGRVFTDEMPLVIGITQMGEAEKVRILVKKTGSDIEPRFYCEIESKITQGAAKEFGIDMVFK